MRAGGCFLKKLHVEAVHRFSEVCLEYSGRFLLVQACLRAPHVVADEAKLAIVFTYFFLLFLFVKP